MADHMKVVAASIIFRIVIGASGGTVQRLVNVSVIVDQKPQGFYFIHARAVIVLELLCETINSFKDVAIRSFKFWYDPVRAKRDVEEVTFAIGIVFDIIGPAGGGYEVARARKGINIAIMEDMDGKR